MKHTEARTRAGGARHWGWWPAAAAIVLACAWYPGGAARAAMYKWVDDKGVVHYSDQVPPDAVNKGSVQLSPQGIQIKKVDPAISPQDRKAREAAQERAQEEAKQQVETARRDRALRDSYTSESDIDLAKSRAVRTLQAALESAQGYSAQLTKRKVGLLERRATYAGKPVPADIEHEIAAIDAELARQSEIIAQKNKQLVEVAAKYDADKERWQALTNHGDGTKPPPAPGIATTGTPSPPAPQSAAKK